MPDKCQNKKNKTYPEDIIENVQKGFSVLSYKAIVGGMILHPSFFSFPNN